MVARSPAAKEHKKMMMPPLNPNVLRETVKKVDKCMARLQELQYTVSGGGGKAGVGPSLRCKQESLRIKNGNSGRSPRGKLPTNTEEWRRMSLPAMLLGETMGEIIQATQFARNIVAAVPITTRVDDPKTPLTKQNKIQHSEFHAPKKRENVVRSESSVKCAKSRINFKVSSPVVVHKKRECINLHLDKENCSSRYIVNRVSPRNRPWATKKTVLFPNPLFHSTSSPTKMTVIAKNHRQTPHKFLIKSPPVKLKNRHPFSISPTKKSPKLIKRSFSPSRFANRLVSPLKNSNFYVHNKNAQSSSSSTAAKLRRSFSPSRLANRFVSPLKSRTTKNEGLKKSHPSSFSVQFSPHRI
ncbi:hypothetical protein BUALT_Bualt14G0013000 [Buddleja alternifolia]|uniref:Microtubule-binding protein TANGLED n=1 Tax=Buddleja alternifolia TaxID=168488 RepID=A0AAV6WDW6_9LAMI|nr:hypothetical protein BUALT_Bualt14G0013000 [Buddleja alternifolia]